MAEEIDNENKRIYAFGPFRLDPAERRLSTEGELVPLATKVFDLLFLLIRAPGHLKTREELVEALWPNTIVEEHGLTSRISSLRKALGDEGEVPRYIETVRGHGYRFIAPVVVEDLAPVSRMPSTSPERRRPRLAAAAVVVLLGIAGALALRFVAWPGKSAAPAIPERSIAVLPFENLSGDPNNAYFANGIQDMILTKLAGIGDLRVISRTSTTNYASRPGDLREVGRAFGVATILEGSVQRAGDQVLINVQLIDARTDSHLWAQAYTRTLDRVFDVEVDVAEQVASALKARLLPAEAARLASAPTRSSNAYDLFLRAEYPAIQVEEGRTDATTEAYERATDLYRRAIAEDPGFDLAKARFSFLLSYGYWFGLDSKPERLADAERLAQSALDSDIPQAHLAMGYVHYWGHRDYDAALAELKLAERGLPNDAAVRGAIAFIQRRQGKYDDALAGLEQAEILDPRNALWFSERGNTFVQLRRYGEAEAEFDRALAVDPNGYRPAAYKALAHLLAGENTRARETLDKTPSTVDSSGVVSVVRYRIAWVGRDFDQALSAIAAAGDSDWIEDPFMSNVPSSLLRAQAWARKGDEEKARSEYEKARDVLDDELRGRPENFNALSALGVTEAGLGHKDDAIRAARRATELIPVARDAIRGSSHLATLAETYARVGEAGPAVELLQRLLDMPAGEFVSVALLRDDPRWDPIRNDPGFQSLLAKHSAATSPASAVASSGR